MRELRVEDALMYLDQVKVVFGDRPQVYNEFLEIMKNFKSMRIDTPGVIRRVSTLFQGNKELVLGFNTFLPDGFKIEIPLDGSGAFFRVPGTPGIQYIHPPNENIQQDQNGHQHGNGAAPQQQQHMHQMNMHDQSHPTMTQQQGQGPPGLRQNQQEANSDGMGGQAGLMSWKQHEHHGNMQMHPSNNGPQGQPQDMTTAPGGPGFFPPQQRHQQPPMYPGHLMERQPPQQQQQQLQQQQQQQGGGPPVEFDHAINYVTTIKKRFASAPDIYKKFLEILHTYQKEQRGIKEVLDEVSVLFADHPDLLKDFTYFLPDAVQEQAKLQLQEAVRIAEERKRQLDAQNQFAMSRDYEYESQRSMAQAQTYEDNVSRQVSAASAASFSANDGSSIPFGGTIGRSDEREREICRSTVYGFASFEPQRPPRKHSLSPAQAAAKFGRPRCIPEPHAQPTTKEAAFFERVRFHLNKKELGPDKPPGSRRHTPHAEFLKLLHLFGAGIVNKEELMILVRTLFTQGHAPKSGTGGANNPYVLHAANILMREFEQLILERGPFAQQETSKKGKSKYGAVTSKEFEINMCEKLTPSYITYPSDYKYDDFHSFSGQTEEDASVLNTKVVCVGSSSKNRLWTSPECYDGIRARRNIYEEAMAKIEDERFEVDMAIERNSSASRQVEPIAKEVSMLRENEENDSQPIGRLNYKLRPKSLHCNHVGAIARLYGDRGDEILHHLLRNPVAVLPIVFKRLREKDSEWRRVRTEMSKKWRVVAENNFEASLDVLCYFYRREIESSFRSENLTEACKRAKHFARKTKEPHVPTEAVAPSFNVQHTNDSMLLYQPYLSVKVSSLMPHKDLYDLVSFQMLRSGAKSNNIHTEKVSRIWTELIVPWFELPLYWFMNELKDKPQSDKTIVQFTPGQIVNTIYGEGEIMSEPDVRKDSSLRYKIRFPFGTGYIRPSSIAYHCSSGNQCVRSGGHMEQVHDESMESDDAKTLNDDCHCIFATEKLYVFMRLYCGIIALLDKVKNHLNEKWQEVPSYNTDKRKASPAKNYYNKLLCAIKDYINEDIEFKNFELLCREMTKERVYEMSALPRLIEKCADALVKVCKEDKALALSDISRLKSKDPILQRQRSLEVAEASYRVQYDSNEDFIHFCYIGRDKSLLTAPRAFLESSPIQDTYSHEQLEDEADVVNKSGSFDNIEEQSFEPSTKRLKL